MKEVEVPKPYPVDRIVEKYIKVPTPYPVKVAVPVEKIREVKVPVVKEIKVPVFIPAPPLKAAHHQNQQNSLGDNYHGFPHFNFDDSLFAGSKHQENLGKLKKIKFNPEHFNNEQDEEPYRRNINLKGSRQNQQPQKNPNQINHNGNTNPHQINHHPQNNPQNKPPNHPQQNHQQNQNNAHQNHQHHQNNAQQNHQHPQLIQLQQQHGQQHGQFGVITIPKNFNKIPFDTPQSPSGFTLTNNNNNNKENNKHKQHPLHFAQHQNGAGSYVVQHNYPAQTVRPVDDHVTEASTQYETFSAYPNAHYQQQVVTPQNYYQSPQPQSQQLVSIPQQQFAYHLQSQVQQAPVTEPQYQLQYPNQIQQGPQQFHQQQGVVNGEVFQPSFGVPQQ